MEPVKSEKKKSFVNDKWKEEAVDGCWWKVSAQVANIQLQVCVKL